MILEQMPFYSDFWSYRPNEGWDSLAIFPAPEPRRGAIAFTIENVGYMGGGINQDSIILNDFWSFSPNDGWDKLTEFQFNCDDSAPCPTFGATAFVINDKAYIGSGRLDFGRDNMSDDLWTFHPSEGWNKLDHASFNGSTAPSPREGAAAFVIDEIAYLGTGLRQDSIVLDDFWSFDPGADVPWTRKAAFSGQDRYDAIGFSLDGNGYITTGFAVNFNAFFGRKSRRYLGVCAGVM